MITFGVDDRHDYTCPARYVSDADCEYEPGCEETLGEVWCERCTEPSERVVESSTGSHALCHEHALTLEWMLTSPSWK
jgi:hypothetical protein